MVINFICRASKAGKEGLSPLELSIIINSQRKVITLDRRIKASSFNAKTQKVRKNPEVNEYIEAVKTKVYSQETEMMKRGITITLDSFIDIYKNGFKSNVISVIQLFKEHNEGLVDKINKGQITATTLNKYVVTMDYLSKFISTNYNKPDMLIKDITPKFVEDFFSFLLDSMSNNTAIQKMKQFKKILRLAMDEGYISSMPYKMTLRKEDKEIIPLTIKELRIIRNKEISIKRLERVRDLFIFECYTGLAYSDMVNLSKDDIILDNEGNEWIIKDRQKTKVTSTIPLLPIAKEILIKYNGKLPTLCNQKYNAYLKELGDICGINKDLHSHLARHTFATILLNTGVDMVSVSKILGHANSRITERVYAKILPNTIMNRVKNIQDKMI